MPFENIPYINYNPDLEYLMVYKLEIAIHQYANIPELVSKFKNFTQSCTIEQSVSNMTKIANITTYPLTYTQYQTIIVDLQEQGHDIRSVSQSSISNLTHIYDRIYLTPTSVPSHDILDNDRPVIRHQTAQAILSRDPPPHDILSNDRSIVNQQTVHDIVNSPKQQTKSNAKIDILLNKKRKLDLD